MNSNGPMRDFEVLNFCPKLQEALSSGQLLGRSGKIHTIRGMSSLQDCLVIRNLMLHFKPQRTLEVGMGPGASAATICATHRDLGHSATNQHVAVDPFEMTDWDGSGELLVEQAGLREFLTIQTTPSYLALPLLLESGQKFDFIYIDGSHYFEDVMIDYYFSEKLLSTPGVLVFDDANRPHVKKAINFVMSNFSNCFDKLNETDFATELPFHWKRCVKKIIGRKELAILVKKSEFERNGPHEPLGSF